MARAQRSLGTVTARFHCKLQVECGDGGRQHWHYLWCMRGLNLKLCETEAAEAGILRLHCLAAGSKS